MAGGGVDRRGIADGRRSRDRLGFADAEHRHEIVLVQPDRIAAADDQREHDHGRDQRHEVAPALRALLEDAVSSSRPVRRRRTASASCSTVGVAAIGLRLGLAPRPRLRSTWLPGSGGSCAWPATAGGGDWTGRTAPWSRPGRRLGRRCGCFLLARRKRSRARRTDRRSAPE